MKNSNEEHFKDRLLDRKANINHTLHAQEEDGLHKPLKDYYNSLSPHIIYSFQSP